MSIGNIKSFDASMEKPLEIKGLKKNGLSNNKMFKQKEVLFNGVSLEMSYTILALQKISEKHNINYDKILTLLYLQELGLFRLTVKVVSRTVLIKDFIRMGYVQEDYSKKRIVLHKLSDLGLGLVQEFYKTLENHDEFISCNRETEIKLDKKIRSTLSGYFS